MLKLLTFLQYIISVNLTEIKWIKLEKLDSNENFKNKFYQQTKENR
jgi:hypothetical protein